MNVCSFPFLLGVGLAAILFHLAPWKGPRRLFLTVVNVAFLVTQVPNWRSWLCFAGFFLLTYGVLRFLKARPSRDHLIASIGLVVCVFVYLRRYDFVNLLLGGGWAPNEVLSGVELVGISYIMFKAIHMMVDQWEGQLAPYGLFSYLNYQLAFFTLLSGPIYRYNDFQEAWQQMDMGPGDARGTLRCWGRLLIGMLQMGLVAPLLWEGFDRAGRLLFNPSAPDLLQGLAGRFYVYPFYLYFNFAGYTNIAIGAGGLFGFRVPENFHYPFLSRNMIDFWNRWHITLSWWIRDYVFMTSYKACAERFSKWSRLCGYGLLFLALLIAGVWHGTTFAFVAFGAAHGFGIMAAQIYTDSLKKGLGRAGFQRYVQSRLIHGAAIVLTFHYICFTFLYFSSGVDGASFWFFSAMTLMKAPGSAFSALRLTWWTGGSILALTVLAVAWWNSDRLMAGLRGAAARLPQRTSLLYAAVCSMAVLTTFVLLASWALQQKDPVVVYMRF